MLIELDEYRMGSGDNFGRHAHDAHQLAWAPSGVLHAEVGDRRWVLPPSQAFWIPSAVEHDLRATRPALLYCLYFDVDACPIRWTAATVVAIEPLSREILCQLARAPGESAARRRLETVLFDHLAPLHVGGLQLVLPVDERARAVADALCAEPADGRTLEAWGRDVGASARTLARLFDAETGMSFSDWRMHARLQRSLDLLAQGTPVALVAARVGYASPSAFVAAFRRQYGDTPRAHFSRETQLTPE